MSSSDFRSSSSGPSANRKGADLAAVKHSLWCALLAFGTALGESAHQDGQGFMLVDPVRVAFYETAPASIAASMQAAVQQACLAREKRDAAHDDAAGSEAPSIAWLCAGKPLRFLRGVDVLGNRQKTGLVCDSKAITPNVKYYTADMVGGDRDCLFAAFSVKTNRHFIDVSNAP